VLGRHPPDQANAASISMWARRVGSVCRQITRRREHGRPAIRGENGDDPVPLAPVHGCVHPVTLGISRHFGHDLRHSLASALANAGTPLYEIGAVLGHRQLSTTTRYAHHSPQRMVETAAVAERTWNLLPGVEAVED
jgi:integrase